MHKLMLIIGDDESPKTYVGLFTSPIVAGDYAAKHFKGKKWLVEYIKIIEE